MSSDEEDELLEDEDELEESADVGERAPLPFDDDGQPDDGEIAGSGEVSRDLLASEAAATSEPAEPPVRALAEVFDATRASSNSITISGAVSEMESTGSHVSSSDS